jgi:PAS domain S-box-containing protein
MPLPLILLAADGGFAVCAGVVSLIAWASNRNDRAAGWFSFIALGGGAYALLQMAILASCDSIRVAAILRWQGLAVAVFLAGVAQFGPALLGLELRAIDRVLFSIYLALGLWSLASPCGYWFTSLDAIRTVPVAGGTICLPHGPLARAYFVSIAAQYVLVGRQAGLAWRLVRAGSRADGWFWGGLQVVFIVVTVHDHAIDLALIRGVYLSEYFFPAFVVMMALRLAVRREAAHRELRLAQAAQAESQARFRDVFENSREALSIQDPESGSILEVNRTMTEMYGWSREEAKQLSVAELSANLPAYSMETARARIAEAQAQGHAFFEWMARRRSGELFSAEVALTRTTIAGEPRILASVRDVTARKRTEAERAGLLAELEAKNAELERKNTELEQFVHTVSHDLTSPLVTILGFLEFIEKAVATGDSERAIADLARIRAAATKMERLLRELLSLSRIGRVVAPPRALDLGALAREAVELLEGAISGRGVEVRIEAGLPQVQGDPVRVREVLQNLLENAIKFMGDQPHPVIRLGSRGSDGAGRRIVFVSDNGIGVERGSQERIFGLFDKVDPASAGSGVGLAIVKRIVEVHGGRAWVESDGMGRGATFCFTLADAIVPRTAPSFRGDSGG